MAVCILGIAGTFQAGKDSVAALIGWKKYSCSDVIREECKKRGLSIDVNQNLVDVGNDLRKSSGNAGILGELIIKKILADKVSRAIVVSIRTPAELLALKGAKGVDFRLLVLDAPIALRFQRAQSLVRYASMSFEQFKAQEDLQLKGADEHSQQLEKVFSFADAKIMNEDSLDDLKFAVSALLKRWNW